jgi:hypothetical protein
MNSLNHKCKPAIELLSLELKSPYLNRHHVAAFCSNLTLFISTFYHQNRSDKENISATLNCAICSPGENVTNSFKITVLKDVYSIKMTYFCAHIPFKRTMITSRICQFETFQNDSPIVYHNLHPYRRFGHLLLQTPNIVWLNLEKESLEEVVHSSKTLQQHTLDKQNMSVNQLAIKIQSHIYICYRPNLKIVFFPFDENNEVIQFTWIFPHAYAIMNEAQYFQIDSSFEVFKPFVFSVPLAIINNDNFPLGLQISLIENC